MPKTACGPLAFYPQYCFQYSATYNTWARLTATDVHALHARSGFEGQNTYFHLNHPIRWVRLVGVVVAFDVYPNRLIMTLDDSSGLTIDIFCRKAAPAVNNTTTVDGPGAITKNNDAKPAADDELVFTTNEGYKVNLKGVDLGSVVKVKGGITLVRTTNEEAGAWAENVDFRQKTLSQPWFVSEREEQQARIEAEGVEREREARKEKRRRHKALEEKKKKKKKKQHEREAKTRAPRRGEVEKNGFRPEVERKREPNDGATSAARKQGVGKMARPHRDATATRQPVRRPITTGSVETLGL
ncbi:MAG: hypothetical protein LQ345_004321 [Seirophora villosa]|nr:MAG: hypothetical protein LQ345_004321 [Seirophora villosa]